MVVGVDVEKCAYKLASMKGKHSPSPDFDCLQIMDFDDAHEYLEKVG